MQILWGMTLLLVVAVAIAAVLPWFQIRAVRVRRVELPTTAQVGEAATLRYEVSVDGWLSRYGVEIHDSLTGGAPTPAAFLPAVRGERTYSFAWTPRMRGCWQMRGLRIESRYPLGLTRSSRQIDAREREIVVYPDYARLQGLPVRNDAHPRFEQMLGARRGGHDEFFGNRLYAPGDERRSIHWRASARLNEVVVREFEQQQDQQLSILLELAEGQHAGVDTESTVEYMIRIAHSIAVKAHEDGIPVGLSYRVADAVQEIPAGADRATYQRIRDALARVNAHGQLPLVRWAQRFRAQLPAGGTWVMFNLGGTNERASLTRIARRRSAEPVFIEFDKASFTGTAADSRVQTRVSSGVSVHTVAKGADLAQLFRS